MPSIQYHIKRSISDPKSARKVSELLDCPPGVPFSPEVHSMWRKKTHNLKSAFLIGQMVGIEDGAPRKAIISALTHLNDDLELTLFNKMMRAKGGDEEGNGANSVKH